MTDQHPVVAALRDTAAADPRHRRDHVVAVLLDAFGPLIEADPAAFRRRFRRMAASPWTFYRGSACLFYADVAAGGVGDGGADRWADERTSRVWIQGDLHAENYGTYMNDEGRLVFDVNDFDEAYLAPFTWDVWRMAASVALLGVAKAFADADIERMVAAYARAYTTQVRAFATGDDDAAFALRLDNTEGPVHDALERARAARRIDLLDAETEIADTGTIDRRFRQTPHHRRLDDDEHAAVLEAFERYLTTIPDAKRGERIEYHVKDVVGRSGIGIGSAGLRTYSLLLEGRTQALENDVVLSMKQGVVAAPSRVVGKLLAPGGSSDLFTDHGHRTAVSQRALQAHADPWLGHTTIDGVGYVVSEVSPYTADLDWDGVDEPDQAVALLGDLGRATAKVHCVADSSSESGDASAVPFQVEEAVVAVLDRAGGGEAPGGGGAGDELFAADAVAFALGYAEVVRDDFRLFVDAFRNGAFPGL